MALMEQQRYRVSLVYAVNKALNMHYMEVKGKENTIKTFQNTISSSQRFMHINPHIFVFLYFEHRKQ